MRLNKLYMADFESYRGNGRLKRHAMTLVELLVVMGIIAILFTLLLPAVHATRESARKLSCKNNLKLLGLAMQHYESTHGVLPCSSLSPEWISASGEWGWGAIVLPFIEEGSLSEQLDYSLWPAEDGNRQWMQMPLSFFRCPSEKAPRHQTCQVWDGYDWVEAKLPNDNYGLNEQFDSLASRSDGCWRFADVTDGLTHTVMLGETTAFTISEDLESRWHWRVTWSSTISGKEEDGTEHDFWTAVDCTAIILPSEQSWDSLCSYHPSGSHGALCDGSVRFFDRELSEEVLRQLADPNDGGLPPD